MEKIENFKKGVYSITSKDGKILYIGASSDIEKRYLTHYGRLNNGNHDNKLLQDFCDYYKFENLIFKTICVCEEHELMYFEKLLIHVLNPICNIQNNIIKVNAGKLPSKKQIKELDNEYKIIDEYLKNNTLKTYEYIRIHNIIQYYVKTEDIINDIIIKYKTKVSAKKIAFVLKEIGYFKKQLPTGERVWIKMR